MYQKLIENYQPDSPMEAKDKELMLAYFKEAPHDPTTREAALAHLTSSGFILNESFDKVLMVHHNLYGTWAWTGGHADGEQDLLAVAIKEAQEETGVQGIRALSEEIMSLDILPVWRHEKKGEPVSSHLHLNVAFLLVASELEALQMKEDENSGVAWFPLTDLKSYCHEPQILPIYEKLIKKAKKLTQS